MLKTRKKQSKRQHFSRTKLLILIILTIFLAFIIGLKMLFWYENRQLEKVLDRLAIPESLIFVKRENSGNFICLDACSGISNMYMSEDEIDNPEVILKQIVNSARMGIAGLQDDCNPALSNVSVGEICAASISNGQYSVSASFVIHDRNKYIKVSVIRDR